ncbi:hypothetical protein HHK36_005115 [Tetracentron sinense]|uniref:Agenet domain-containing protein n=1 Tax=Tetracentron sinense TaxID=13715 RepID=A0A834ZPS7_TETSI|nr:hypothetical protein HHK36_005115 [Tetracentron sinense]
MVFRKGAPVEICSNQDGFRGSYYAATVLAAVGKDRFLVEYCTLLTDDEKNLLREIVDAAEVRPAPPEILVSDFSVLDIVDAYDNDGWWVGRITGRVPAKYFVYFDSTGDEIAYPSSQLRVHQDWENGKWVSSKKRALRGLILCSCRSRVILMYGVGGLVYGLWTATISCGHRVDSFYCSVI